MTSLRIINVPATFDGHDVRDLFAQIGTVVSVQDVTSDIGRACRAVRVVLAEDGIAAHAIATLHGSQRGDHFLIVRDETQAPPNIIGG